MDKMQTRVFLLSMIPFYQQHPDFTKREIEKLSGEYAIKKVFADLFGMRDIKINHVGKPHIENCAYHFNISHSGDYFLLAVGDTPVGVDIEKITRIRPKTMEKYFNQSEQDEVAKQGTDVFFELWCQKESYVKYTGEGIKALSRDMIYPDKIAFFTKKHEDYQISVCTKKDCLPNTIEILV